MKYLFIIPARGGSKGIPRKNIFEINGYPLIYYSISAALEVKKIIQDSKVIVSTDNEEIKEVSIKFGAEVPFIRPKELSDDRSKSVEYVNHAIKYFEENGQFFEHVVILQPTSPLRTFEDIFLSIQIYETHKADSLISVYEEQTINEKIIYIQDGLHCKPADKLHNAGMRRQEDESFLVRNGAIYITQIDFFKEAQSLVSNKPLIYVMPKSKSINIDTPEDMLMAEKLIV